MKTGCPSALGDAPDLVGILTFLQRIGLSVVAGTVPADAVLPAMTVRGGAVVYDPAQPGRVGDLLHEAGHLAVTDPMLRNTLSQVGNDPAEEMATIAWSYAAAMAIGVPVGTLFHAGYKGGAGYLIAAFAERRFIGLPMLQYWRMAVRDDQEGPRFPAMRTWLRPQ